MQQNDRVPNRLINESSPYLLQHAYNPVDWHPWGEEALQKAKLEDKMILVSIGYAACHWCHVMEHESFEDSTVASIMNENFICIKVDREERPDVDDVYMTACQLTSGSGCGWPLNAFTLPDGRPVWAGTYFPKDNWINILNQFQDMKQADPEKLNRAAESITKGISNFGAIEVVDEEKVFEEEELSSIANRFIESVDLVDGGRKGAPKFPMPNNYEFLLRYSDQYDDPAARDAALLTLDKMAAGGIYDQVGGGFARYSVDAYWKVPHFEKMLYDNGQLLGLYADAYKLTGKQRYLKVIKETVDFASNELMDESGGFYSSYDADSEGEEGVYYIWTKEELRNILDTEAEIVSDFYSVTDAGNWEDKNILHITVGKNELVQKHNLENVEALDEIVESAKQKLKEERKKRIKPGLDDKVLASWNGLMLSGLTKVYTATKDKKYLDLAVKNATFLKDQMVKKDGRIDRNYKNGKSTINGFLDDYGNVASGFIDLYQVTFDKQWLDQAMKVMAYAKENFWDEEDQMFGYTNRSDAPLIAKTRNYSDNVIPAGNSIMARNLFHLGILYSDDALVNQSRQMLTNVAPLFVSTAQPSFYSNWLQLYLDFVERPYEVAIVGEDAMDVLEEIQGNFISNALFMGGTKENLPLLSYKLQEGETNIYVCKNKVCKFPVKSVKEAMDLLK